MLCIPIRRMGNDRTDPGEIVRQVWRANKGGLGSMLGRDRRDFLVISRNNQRVKTSSLPGGFEDPGQNRPSGEWLDVFARYPLRTATGGNNGDVCHVSARPRRSMTSSCWASDMPGKSGMVIASS